jgi:outer membrane protein assembly factor BamB
MTALARSLSAFASLLFLHSPWLGAAEETKTNDHPAWNQFRGPSGAGVAANGDRPPLSPDTTTLAWKAPVPPGLSSPILAGLRVVLTGVENGRLVTLAIDRKTGALAWRREAPEVPLERVHQTSSPAASTPTADAGKIFVYFGSFGLVCYNFEGAEVWRHPLPTPKSLYGLATSPVVYKDSVILVLDSEENLEGSTFSRSRLIALAKSNGEPLWETPRPLVRSGWSTPALWPRDGIHELVVLGTGRVTGYDPENGQERWHATGFSQETIAQPVIGNDLVFASSSQIGGGADETIDPKPLWESVLSFDTSGDGRLQREEMTGHFTFPLRPELAPGHPGYGIPLPSGPEARRNRLDGMFRSIDADQDGHWSREEFATAVANRPGKPRLLAIRPGGSGDVTATHAAWELNRHIPEIPTPLFFDGRLYLMRNGGLLSCVDAPDGTVLYTERLDAPGQYSASPVAADGHIFLVSNRGVLTVVKAGATFERTHQHSLGEAALVTPAVDQNTLYVRTEGHLHAFRRSP